MKSIDEFINGIKTIKLN